ncbi:nitroreductase [Amycolatopsis lexingtonensis]|uniref:Nitroreductase n=1 Tax=Amycolatopsis lexingtonensis TaxID=218822 RepID=A0ABR9HSM8_9PSEU|nr:hypothetical protein [Amycolatopsis lexingtonensis]MBE1493928.1 nitroreductase [Amycolatopsis lexingtonensis]
MNREHDDSPGRTLDRRRVLGLLGLGAGTLAVAGAGGLTWRAVDSGVYATARGSAYAAWNEWNPPEASVLNLVRAAVLAANAHNTQPWLFRVEPDRIDLYADMTRGIGTMDPLHRELDVSLGCALENLVLAGPPNELAPAVTLLPDPARPELIARIGLIHAARSQSSLFAAIGKRHTDRGAYDTGRPLSPETREAITGLLDPDTTPDTVRLAWLTGADGHTFGDLTVRATEAINADAHQAADDFAWYRTSRQKIQSTKDGVTIDASGRPPLIRAAAKLLGTSRQQNADGWLRATRDSQVATAAAFGILVARDARDRVQRLQVGRSWQRMHLWATGEGLAVQPLNQVLERMDRESTAGLPPRFTDATAALLPSGWHPVMAFRIGYPTGDALPSPRRPAEDVRLR